MFSFFTTGTARTSFDSSNWDIFANRYHNVLLYIGGTILFLAILFGAIQIFREIYTLYYSRPRL